MRNDPTVVALVERARARDQAAWNQIVERYAALVWSICHRYRLTEADAHDVGGSVWLRLVERLGTLRDPAALPGWIATTTQRECLQLLKAKKRQVPVDELVVDEAGPASDEWLLVEEKRIALRVAFAELPAQCRQLLSMLFGDPPMPYSQIGATLGTAIGSIGPSRSRCLDKLRNSPTIVALLDKFSEE